MSGSPIVSIAELASLLGGKELTIVDCRFDLAEPDRGETEYLAAHIPGAVYAHLERDLSGPKTGRNGRHPLPSVEEMSDRFASWGIGEGVRVVAYDGGPGQVASRLWWMLRYLGHQTVSVLDGGFSAWSRRSLPVQSGPEQQTKRHFHPRPRPEMRVDLTGVEHSPSSPNRSWSLLIDARDPVRYRGEAEPLDPVAGHIPGARNHFWQDNLDDHGLFLSPDRLRERFTPLLDGAPPKDTVVYCGSGVTACHNLLALELAGIDGAKLYPGSWSEWCAHPDRPVETGETKS